MNLHLHQQFSSLDGAGQRNSPALDAAYLHHVHATARNLWQRCPTVQTVYLRPWRGTGPGLVEGVVLAGGRHLTHPRSARERALMEHVTAQFGTEHPPAFFPWGTLVLTRGGVHAR